MTVQSPQRREVLFSSPRIKMYPQLRVRVPRGTPVCSFSLSYGILVSAQVRSALLHKEVSLCGAVLIDTHAPAPAVISLTLHSRGLESVQREGVAGFVGVKY